MNEQKILNTLKNLACEKHISFLLDDADLGGYSAFNYEKHNIDGIIALLEYVGGYFYRYNGTLNSAFNEKHSVVLDDLQKVFLLKNMKILFDKFIVDVKNKKLEFAVVCHNKTIRTILTCMLNIPLRLDIKLYKETPSGLTYQLFNREDSYSIRFSDDLIKVLYGTPSKNIQRRINIVKARIKLQEYANLNNIDTDGVFAKLSQKGL